MDVFLTTQTFVDIASISVVPGTTGGQVVFLSSCALSKIMAKGTVYLLIKSMELKHFTFMTSVDVLLGTNELGGKIVFLYQMCCVIKHKKL